MRSLGIQFHALAQELAAVILAATAKTDIHIILHGGVPFFAREISPTSLEDEMVRAASETTSLSVYLFFKRPDLDATTRLKFYDLNPGGIVIDIGRLTAQGLKQSAISTKTEDPLMYEFAKALANCLRKISHAGVTAINIDTGVSHLNKSSRYTDGAKKLEQDGVPMLLFAGGVKLLLGDVRSNDLKIP